MEVNKGVIHSLIGPNGAGKTTVFNAISGLVKSYGKIILDNHDISKVPAYKRALFGLGRSFQNIIIFKYMTVLENLLVGYHPHLNYSSWDQIFKTKRVNALEKEAWDLSVEVADIVGLKNKLGLFAGNLPYGIQKLIDVGRALMLKPKLLLLDEPAAGLTEAETEKFKEALYRIKNKGITVLLVEHDMNLVMDISDKITVLNFGKKIAEGVPAEIANNPEVIKAYLGDEISA
ncbi:ABC transporter ATP-binding protein [Thermosipho ferrireducens]|uniref:ABC transporter ATP-binding protein n=2 Tax=Thermosipho ferrireducens TaxID=2571116 RepID=A0ABX7S8J3_9BACT|nr:ABC transporter ATP-binding protein [Thermosipho ferrireducens]